jgi:hypothetical protein
LSLAWREQYGDVHSLYFLAPFLGCGRVTRLCELVQGLCQLEVPRRAIGGIARLVFHTITQNATIIHKNG